MPKKKEKESEGPDVDLGAVKFSFGGLFKGIEKLIDLAAELKEGAGEVKKEGEIDLSRLFGKGESAAGGKEGLKGVYGFSIKTALGGKPVVETFGNIKKTAQGSVVVEEREPLTDVFEEKDEVLVISEIPGINEEGITLLLTGDILEISAVSKKMKYHKEVLLPVPVKKETLSRSYKNGVLEVRIKKSE